MMHTAWSSIEKVPYCISRSFVKFQGYTEKHRFWPKLGVSRLWIQFEFTSGYEIMQKASSNSEKVPCYFSRSSVKFQGHAGQQETCRSIKLRELSACGRFVSHTKATEHKCRMTAHGPSSTSQLRRPRMLRCHCLPPRSLHVLGAFGSLSKSHISFKVT